MVKKKLKFPTSIIPNQFSLFTVAMFGLVYYILTHLVMLWLATQISSVLLFGMVWVYIASAQYETDKKIEEFQKILTGESN